MRNKTMAILVSMLAALAGVRAADEISAVVTLRVTDGYLTYQRSANSQFTITNTLPQVAGDSQALTTNWTAITTAPLTVKGWSWFRNLSTNNTMRFGPVDASTNYYDVLRLKPGEYWVGRLGTNTLYGALVSDVTNETSSIVEKAIFDD